MADPPQDPLGPVPERNRAGHHDEHDQDKPDPDAFAECLGITRSADPSRGRDHSDGAEPQAETWSPGDAPGQTLAIEPAPWRMAVRLAAQAALGPVILAGRLAEGVFHVVEDRLYPQLPHR